ncbi:hypothetical protein L1887_48994 [Cichorium endivia]|nr:hypothetical protein L1887_48994 [Cichorium endivia]
MTRLDGEAAGGHQRQHHRFDEEEDSQETSTGTVRTVADAAARAPRREMMQMRVLNLSGVPGSARATGGGGGVNEAAQGDASKKAGGRDAIQLLDKPGVATLVRLLFFPQMNAKQTSLHKVLANLSENAKTRSELLNLLLMVLSEGSVDAHAVDRSFVSMSNRANRMHATPSRPTPKRANSGPASAVHGQAWTPGGAGGSSGNVAPLSKTGDEAPFLIASRSLDTLLHLTAVNAQAALYFLRDDSRPPKRSKGKEKEKDGVERGWAPLNVLLGLLAKETILANSQLVDSLLALLSTVTKPLLAVTKPEESKRGTGGAGESTAAAEAAEASSGSAPATSTAATSSGSNHAGAAPAEAAANAANAKAAKAAQANEASRSLVVDLDELLATLPEHVEEDEAEEEGGGKDKAEAGGSSETPGAGEGTPSGVTRSGIVISGPTVTDRISAMSGGQRIESKALAALASPANAQAVLLRSLRALDYIMTGRALAFGGPMRAGFFEWIGVRLERIAAACRPLRKTLAGWTDGIGCHAALRSLRCAAKREVHGEVRGEVRGQSGRASGGRPKPLLLRGDRKPARKRAQ